MSSTTVTPKNAKLKRCLTLSHAFHLWMLPPETYMPCIRFSIPGDIFLLQPGTLSSFSTGAMWVLTGRKSSERFLEDLVPVSVCRHQVYL